MGRLDGRVVLVTGARAASARPSPRRQWRMAEAALGPVSVLVNDPGIVRWGTFADLDPAVRQEVLGVAPRSSKSSTWRHGFPDTPQRGR